MLHRQRDVEAAGDLLEAVGGQARERQCRQLEGVEEWVRQGQPGGAQHLHIEPDRLPDDRMVAEKRGERRGDRREGRGAAGLGLGDAGELRDAERHRSARADGRAPAIEDALGRELDRAEFDDLAALGVHLGRLKVERDVDRVTHRVVPLRERREEGERCGPLNPP